MYVQPSGSIVLDSSLSQAFPGPTFIVLFLLLLVQSFLNIKVMKEEEEAKVKTFFRKLLPRPLLIGFYLGSCLEKNSTLSGGGATAYTR